MIIAVVVMIAIVIASIVILFDPFDADTAGLPSGALSAGDSGNVSARPTSAPSPSPSTGSRIGPTTSAGTEESPRTGAPTPTAGRAPAEAGTAVSGAAKLAAKSWVDALNKQRVGPAQALSCAAVRPKITASFVATVAGSIKVVSILKDPSAGTTTLTFSYRKTTDTGRQHDHLSLITEAGSWKVCT